MSSLIIPKEEPDLFLYEDDLQSKSQIHPSTSDNPLNFSNTSADKAIQRSQQLKRTNATQLKDLLKDQSLELNTEID